MSILDIRYGLVDWKESAVIERPDGSKVTQVQARFAYTGDLTGDTVVAYVMRYQPDGHGVYDGWERLVLHDGGEILLRHEGDFDPAGVDVRVRSVPGTGLGSLDGASLRFAARLTGHGPYPLRIERA